MELQHGDRVRVGHGHSFRVLLPSRRPEERDRGEDYRPTAAACLAPMDQVLSAVPPVHHAAFRATVGRAGFLVDDANALELAVRREKPKVHRERTFSLGMVLDLSPGHSHALPALCVRREGDPAETLDLRAFVKYAAKLRSAHQAAKLWPGRELAAGPARPSLTPSLTITSPSAGDVSPGPSSPAGSAPAGSAPAAALRVAARSSPQRASAPVLPVDLGPDMTLADTVSAHEGLRSLKMKAQRCRAELASRNGIAEGEARARSVRSASPAAPSEGPTPAGKARAPTPRSAFSVVRKVPEWSPSPGPKARSGAPKGKLAFSPPRREDDKAASGRPGFVRQNSYPAKRGKRTTPAASGG